jgi:tetratricopeptide (TPR) repeat protein
MRLFVERGRQVRPDLAPAAEAQAIRRICRAVGGVPLAIELAAASLRFYTCGQIAEALKENLDFLSSSQRDLPARHRSLRAIFNHSWRLLDEEGRQAFAALAVFRGSFTPDAARAVLDSASPLLHELVDQSLLQRADAGRFRLHNTLRQYALEKLAADSPHQHEAARDRHGAYYTALLAKMRPRLRGGGQKEALEVITAEIENLRAGWRYLSTSQRRTERLPVLHDAADAWFWFFYQRSRFREGAALLQETITRFTPPAAAGERLLLARLRARYGWLAYLADDGENGRAALTQALAAFEEIDYAAGVLFCCNYLGAIAAFRAQYERAETLLQRALTLAQALDDKSGESIALNIMGTMATQRGRLARAADLLRQSLALKRGIDDRWGVAFSLESLGAVDAQRQRPDAAAVRYRESLAIRQEMGDRRGVALCLQRLGDLAAQCGDAARAAELYGECLAILEDIGATAAVTAVRQKVTNLSAKM